MYSFCKSFCVIWVASSFILKRILASSAKHDTVEFVISLFISDICIMNKSNTKRLFEKHTITRGTQKNDLTAIHVITRAIDLQL